MFTAALLTIAKIWKQPKCPSTDEWVKKMWIPHTMEYYSAIKKNEILPFAATWMDLEGIMLSETNQMSNTSLMLLPVSSLYGSCDYIGSTRIIEDFSTSGSLT